MDTKTFHMIPHLIISAVVFFSQVVLTSWVFISVKMTMEMIFGGQYNPVFPCLWALYFHRHMVLAMIVQFAAYSVITLTLNIAIFVKVKCRTLKRNQLGKRNRYPHESKYKQNKHSRRMCTARLLTISSSKYPRSIYHGVGVLTFRYPPHPSVNRHMSV